MIVWLLPCGGGGRAKRGRRGLRRNLYFSGFTPSVRFADSSLPLLACGHFPLTGGIGPRKGGAKFPGKKQKTLVSTKRQRHFSSAVPLFLPVFANGPLKLCRVTAASRRSLILSFRAIAHDGVGIRDSGKRIAAPVCGLVRNDGRFSPLLRGDIRRPLPSAFHQTGGSLRVSGYGYSSSSKRFS